MWFNEEEDFDDSEAVVPAAAADLVPPASAKKQPPSPNSSPNPVPADSKSQQQTVLNNNTSSNTVTTPQTPINNSVPIASESPVNADNSPSTAVSSTDKAGANIFKKVRKNENYFIKKKNKNLFSPQVALFCL